VIVVDTDILTGFTFLCVCREKTQAKESRKRKAGKGSTGSLFVGDMESELVLF